jgi:hypothetical protein
MTMKKQTKALATDASTSTNTIPYDQAVAEGKKILAKIEDAERGQLRLGELAAKVETIYGDRTLSKFAKELGIAPCTLARYRDVFRAYEAYEDICAPGRESSYAVLRELATHPDRAQVIRANPKTTKREAQELRRKLEGTAKGKQEQAQEDEWLRDNRRWFADLVAVADKASRVAGMVDLDDDEQLDKLLPAVDPGSLMYVRKGGRMLFRVANRLAEKLGVDAEEASAPIAATAQAAVA